MPEQAAKVEALLDKPSQNYQVADMVFAEMVWVLQGPVYGYPRQHIAGNIRSILAIPQINCNRSMLEKALDLYVAHPNISFTDACLSVYAELNNATPLITYDKKLAGSLPKTVKALNHPS
jgi:predicted nucleic-acid-binding protein